jgi:ABC-type sugar transport system permease subunit
VTLSLRIFQEGLLFFKYGFASAVSMVLMALVAVVGVIGLVWFRRREVVL